MLCRAFVVEDDKDFPPPGFEQRLGPSPAATNGRSGAGRGAGRPASRASGASAPKVISVQRAAAAQEPRSPDWRRRGKQLNVEAQNFQPGRTPPPSAGPSPAPAATPAPAPAPIQQGYQQGYAVVAPTGAAPAQATMPLQVYQLPDGGLAVAQPQAMAQAQAQQVQAPAVAAAHMSAQQSAAALQQIAMGGGFAPAIMQPVQQQQPVQAQQGGVPGQPQPQQQMQQMQQMQYMQPIQYAPAPGMQPGYTYVAVPYPGPGGRQGRLLDPDLATPGLLLLVACLASIPGCLAQVAAHAFAACAETCSVCSARRHSCLFATGRVLTSLPAAASPPPAGMPPQQTMPTYQPTYQAMEAPRNGGGAPGHAMPPQPTYMPAPQYVPAPQYAPAPEQQQQQQQGGGVRRYSAVAGQGM